MQYVIVTAAGIHALIAIQHISLANYWAQRMRECEFALIGGTNRSKRNANWGLAAANIFMTGVWVTYLIVSPT